MLRQVLAAVSRSMRCEGRKDHKPKSRRLSREALELSAWKNMQLVEAILGSFNRGMSSSDLRPEEKKQPGELRDYAPLPCEISIPAVMNLRRKPGYWKKRVKQV
jgi:hypothetical protein